MAKYHRDSIRIASTQTLTIQAVFQNEDGDPIAVTGNPQWYLINKAASKYVQPQLATLTPNGSSAVLTPTGLKGVVAVTTCVHTDDKVTIDDSQNRVCKTLDVYIDVVDSEIEFDTTKNDDGPGPTGSTSGLTGGVTALIGIPIPVNP